MAAKKPDTLFPFSPAQPQVDGGLSVGVYNRSLTKGEQHSIDAFHKQLLVTELTRQKATAAERALGRMRYSAVQSFTETAESIWAVKAIPGRDAGLQDYITHFSEESIRAAGTYIHEATNIGSRHILAEVDRSLWCAEPPGLLARIFGRRDSER